MIKISSCTHTEQPKERKRGQQCWSRCACIDQVLVGCMLFGVLKICYMLWKVFC